MNSMKCSNSEGKRYFPHYDPMSLLLPQLTFPSLNPHLPISAPSKPNPRNSIIVSIHLSAPEKRLPFAQKPSLCPSMSPSIEQSGLQQDWLFLLQTCIKVKEAALGLAIHAFLVKSAIDVGTFPGNNLINMYSKFFKLSDAQQMFDQMPVRNTVSWTSLMKGYSSVNDSSSVLRISREMHECGEKFNEHTCSCVLGSVEDDLGVGEQIHALAVKLGVNTNVVVGTSLISMYSNNGQIMDMELVFGDVAHVDIRCLNSLILEHKKNGDWVKAILAFIYVLETGLQPNEYTFTNTISACDECVDITEGRQLHGLAIKYGAMCELSVGNAVVVMYGKLGWISDAEKVFHAMTDRNLVSWTAVFSIRAKSGIRKKMIDGFFEMHESNVGFDPSCFSTVLDAFSQVGDFKIVSQIHACVFKLGHAFNVFVGTALIDAYAKSGGAKEARFVFDGLPNPSIASFNALLEASLETCGAEDDVMILFNELISIGLNPDEVTFARLLRLSASQSLVVHGKAFHGYVIKTGLDEVIAVGNAVVSMYGKCGCIEDASAKFKEMTKRDHATWNTIIAAHAIHGQGIDALLLFKNMIGERIHPDERTLVSILQACSYSGLLDEGIRIFQSMQTNYGTRPSLEHHVCMVDLLGRRGDLEQAMKLIEESKFRDEPQVWRSMVNVCKLRGDLNFGKLASSRLIDLAPDDTASYILTANMYSEGGKLEEAAEMRVAMRERKLRKETGCSWIALGTQVHHFIAGGTDHSKSRGIHERLIDLNRHLKEF